MNFKRLHNIFLSFFLLFSTIIWSQESYNEFNFVNIKEGISNLAVSTIIQDHYGFTWIGTSGGGLYKFDGINYKSYKYKINDSTSLNSSLLYASYLDKENRLWFGTEEGLNLYNRDLDRFTRFSLKKSIGQNNDVNISVSSICSDKAGNIFIGTFEQGLFILDIDTHKITKVPNIKNGVANDIININSLKNVNGKIYAGTSLGLKEYDLKNNTLKTSYFNTKDGAKSLTNPIQSLVIDNDNAIWAGTLSEGLFKIELGDIDNGKAAKFHSFEITNKRILSSVSLPNNSLLFGTENDGLFHLDSSGKLIKNYLLDKTDKNSIRSNSIWSLFLDSDNRIWMGYYNRGIGVYDKLYDKFKGLESLPNKSNSLENPSVTGITQDEKGHIWIGMDGGGIDVYDPINKSFKHINKNSNKDFSGLIHSDIQTVFIDSKKNLWAGTWNNGLFILPNGTKKFVNYSSSSFPVSIVSNSIMSFSEDSKGIIWIGTFNHGLMSYNPNTKTFENYNSKAFTDTAIYNSSVRKVLVDKEDNIWVGTTGGLYRVLQNDNMSIEVQSMYFRMSQSPNSKSNANHILCLFEDKIGDIWIGTKGAGLCKYEIKNDEFIWYNQESKLKEEIISSIIGSDDGDIWISSNYGITKFDNKTKKTTNYSTNDGLLSDNFNYNAAFKDSEGMLYFGGYTGLDFFNPQTINTNKALPNLHLTGFKLFNKDIAINDENSPLKKVISETKSIVLDHTQSVFTIEYSGVNYTRPEKNQYAYYLDGLEESWNYVGNLRSATYTNLDQGNYIFKLKSANNDGVWTNEPLELKITILPPWWKTKIALFLYITLFLIGLYLLNKITKERIRERQEIKNERIQRAQEDELHEKKLQFFTNISHEFRTPLTLMINPLTDIIKENRSNLSARDQEKLKTIHKNTDRLYRLINELMDFRKLELNKVKIKAKEIKLLNFTEEIISYFKEEALNRNVHLTVDSDIPDLTVWGDESMLEKIIFNILSNAMKVTPNGGAITIALFSKDDLYKLPLVSKKKKSKAVEIIISDTGPGLEKEQTKRIFERFYQVENLNKTYYGGTGIGLEVVKNFVSLHKGRVKVKSNIGKGTTFKILLPAGKAHLKEDEIISHKEEAVTQKERFILPHTTLKSKDDDTIDAKTKSNTLLIVEDNDELRDYLKNELNEHYKILLASNGREGLDIAKASPPEIIITDVMMPEMDGFKFCKEIKSDIRTSHIPLLMLTAKTRIGDRIEGIGLGADAYMIKPFDLTLLKLRLSQLITSRQLIFDKYFGAISGSEENANATSIDKDFIQKVLTYINDNISDSDLSVEILASELHLSRSQLYRKIKSLTGQTVNEFLRKVRLKRARQILETENSNISEVCYKVGFSSPSYFTKCFKAHFGILPTEIESKK